MGLKETTPSLMEHLVHTYKTARDIDQTPQVLEDFASFASMYLDIVNPVVAVGTSGVVLADSTQVLLRPTGTPPFSVGGIPVSGLEGGAPGAPFEAVPGYSA